MRDERKTVLLNTNINLSKSFYIKSVAKGIEANDTALTPLLLSNPQAQTQ